MWFENEGGGSRDGGPDDPRFALLLVSAHSVHYLISKYSKTQLLFEIGEGLLTGPAPDVGWEEGIDAAEVR